MPLPTWRTVPCGVRVRSSSSGRSLLTGCGTNVSHQLKQRGKDEMYPIVPTLAEDDADGVVLHLPNESRMTLFSDGLLYAR